MKASVAALVAAVALAGLFAVLALDWMGAGAPTEAVGPSAAAAPPQEEVPLAPLSALPAAAPEVRAEVESPPQQEQASVPVAERPTPRAVLTGRVVDGRRLALAGVEVRVEHHVGRSGKEREPARAQSVVDGRFRLELELESGRSAATARAVFEREGYAKLERDVVLAEGEQDLGEIALLDAGRVEGLVLDERGAPLAGMRVVALPAELAHQADAIDGPLDHDGLARTDAGGRFALSAVPVGPHLIGAGGEGWAWGYESEVEVRARAVQRDVVLRLARLPDERTIELVVLSPAGEPVPGAAIQYTYSSERQSGSGSSSADERGRYRHLLAVLVPHTFTAGDPEGRLGSAVARGVLPGARSVELRLAERRALELLVRASDGRPVESYRASANSLGRNGQQIASAAADGEREGRAVMVLPGEPFQLDVVAEGFAVPELAPLDPATAPATLEIVLQPLPGVSGVVLRGGSPAAGARVMLIESQIGSDYQVNGFLVRSEPWPTSEARAGEDGSFQLTLRESGDWFVRAELDGCAAAEIGPLELDAQRGASGLELRLGQGGAIEGRLVLPLGESPAGAVIGISRGDAFAITRRADAEGAYRFERLTPGRWLVKRRRTEILPGHTTSTVSGRAAGELPWSCEVREGEVTRFDLDLSAGTEVLLEGRLTLSGAPAAGWTAAFGLDDGSQHPALELVLDEQGSYRGALEEPGRYSLVLGAPDGRPPLHFEAELDLAVGPNRFEREVQLGALGGKVGTLPAGGETIRFGWSQGDLSCAGTVSVGPDGSYRLDPAPAGEIVLWCRQPERRSAELGRAIVPAGGEARLDLP